MPHHFRLLACVEGQLGHSNHAGERRPHFVAHVSQELALDTVGLFGARGGGGQVARPFRYRAFQLLTNGALAKQSPRQPHHPAQHQGPTHLSRRRRRRQRLCQIGGMKTGQAALVPNHTVPSASAR